MAEVTYFVALPFVAAEASCLLRSNSHPSDIAGSLDRPPSLPPVLPWTDLGVVTCQDTITVNLDRWGFGSL